MSNDRQIKAATHASRPLFHTFARSVSSCPARNKQCHWPLSSTDAPLRSQTHSGSRPDPDHDVLAPYQRKIHTHLLREQSQWICWGRPHSHRRECVINRHKRRFCWEVWSKMRRCRFRPWSELQIKISTRVQTHSDSPRSNFGLLIFSNLNIVMIHAWICICYSIWTMTCCNSYFTLFYMTLVLLPHCSTSNRPFHFTVSSDFISAHYVEKSLPSNPYVIRLIKLSGGITTMLINAEQNIK